MKLRNFITVISIPLTSSAFAAWSYTVLHPTGAASSFGEGIFGTTQVGYSQLSGAYHASKWSGTQASFVDLHPTGATSSVAYDSTATQQGGYAIIGGLQRAGIWSGTAASWVSLSPAGFAPSAIFDIDNSTQVGYVTSGGVNHAAKWTGSATNWVDLHPNNAVESIASGVSASNQVGSAKFGIYNRAALWTGSAASYVDLQPPGALYSSAIATSGAKQVGTVNISGVQHAALWSGSKASFVDLHPAGYDLTAARGVAGNYQVGYFIEGSENHAAVWQSTAASMVDLHDSLPANYEYSFASSVWTDGSTTTIIGYAYNGTTNREEAILWTRADPEAFSLTLNKASVAGQNSVQGTISASVSSPSSRVYTTYDNSSLVNTPPTVTLPANTLVKNFQITTIAVNSPINTTIYAKRGNITRSQPLTLTPLIPTALAFTPTQVIGGQATSCRVVINGVAGPGGRTIAIFDNSTNATTPGTVVVPAGGTQVTFNIPTTAVTSLKTVTVTARVSAGEKTGTFRIAP